ncbi:PD40 domain-containing protein [Candidatus Chloroploca sp. M-50]|uniref:PD40 domain-containing protein n=1 Tax=Candidatus Chloroploca mongolica TaxID=2528176 RepID=A0ABS4DCJ4_9CHLR|nr:clostripain-related cysteine peptidase [Candidatus Chloroploca mongolica]MBP1467166.1 PD40 domain-containing protein [Candidatus Chloroploca mongolica]
MRTLSSSSRHGRVRLGGIFAMLGILALILAVLPLQAQPATDNPLARLSVATTLQASAAMPSGDSGAMARSSAQKPIFAMEGPARSPDRAGGVPLLSLADRSMTKDVRRLLLNNASGEPGSMIEVQGFGYAPHQRVKLLWNGVNVTERRLILPDFDGTFRTSFIIPEPMTNGVHTLTAIEATLSGAMQAATHPQLTQSSAAFTVVGGLPQGSVLPPLGPPSVTFPVLDPSPELAQIGQPTTKQWTVAVYIAGDNDLSNYAQFNIDQMIASGGTTNDVNIVVLSDESNRPTTLYEVQSNKVINVTGNSDFSGNLDTGDPATFVRFMNFVKQNYPANQYAVVIWNHGGGWKAIETDDVSSNFWNMLELRQALQQGLAALGKSQFDLLIFDACLMGQYEVAYEIKDYVSLMVASEEVVPGPGFPYHTFLRPVLQNPTIDPKVWAAQIVAAYANFYRGNDGGLARQEFTVSAVNLDQPFDELIQRVNNFANAILNVGSSAAGDLLLAGEQTQFYHDRDFRDLYHYAQNVRTLNLTGVTTPAEALINAFTPGQNNVIIAEDNGTRSPQSFGLSVHMPLPAGRPGGFDPRAGGFDPRSPINYSQIAIQGTPWYTLARAQYLGEWPNVQNPEPDPTLPPPPPPAAASFSDLVYARVVNTEQRDLYRIQSTASAEETAETFPLLSDGFANSYPRWSPDGQQVVYVSNRHATPSEATSLNLNLFLVDADGTGPGNASGPQQLTFGTVNCPNGPGNDLPCTIEQSYDPSWDFVATPAPGLRRGIFYTKLRFDLSSSDPLDWEISQAIHYLNLSKQPGQTDFDIMILGPGAGFYNTVEERYYNVYYENADYNGRYLMFRYTMLEDESTVNPVEFNLIYNQIGFIDYMGSSPRLVYLVLHTTDEVYEGDYLWTNYPSWRPGTDEMAFLYTRVGDPWVMQGLDPRPAPDPFVAENPFSGSYDLGRLSFSKQDTGYFYDMEYPIWPFVSPETGEGVNFRPAWKPDESGGLTASYTVDGGYTYDIGLFLNAVDDNFEDDRGFLITGNGYSYLPSWGKVTAADIQARMEIKPPYLEPGNNARYYVSGSGFAPGTTVTIFRGLNQEAINTEVTQATSDASGNFEAELSLPKGTPPGSVYYVVRTASTESNVGRLVVLAPRTTNVTDRVYLPLMRR